MTDSGTVATTVASSERAPLTAPCDDLDPTRCLLPWPSSAFTITDAASPTGVRLALDPTSLPGDDVSFANQADGFSRLTPVAAGFRERLDTSFLDGAQAGRELADAPLRLLDVSGTAPVEVPLWMEVVSGGSSIDPVDLILAYPLAPLAEGAEHLIVITDELRTAEGATPDINTATRVALGLQTPASSADEALAAYHAANVERLGAAGFAPEQVVRMWDFTTRTQADVTGRLSAMLAAVDPAELGVEIDSMSFNSTEEIAGIVRGRVTGVPGFVSKDRTLVLDADGTPLVQGADAAEFRVTLPSSAVDTYRVVLYGHGTGGSVADSEFDAGLAGIGAAKVGVEFRGWRGEDLAYTVQDFAQLLLGSHRSTAQLLQSIVCAYAVLHALDGVLAETLAAETIAGEVNPVAGARPEGAPMWMGGSLGGSMGAVISAAWPEINAAVLNVPSGAWTHIFPHALFYTAALEPLLLAWYDDDVIDLRLAVAMAQGSWDDVDGAIWALEAAGGTFLLQESMDDPISPNPGTDVLARALEAQMVGPQLSELPDLEAVDSAVGRSGMTQYRVPATDAYDVHGFAARSTIAGDAAMEQILAFTLATWEGTSQIDFPAGCADVTPNGDCDFSEIME